jgi:hypothetical protein
LYFCSYYYLNLRGQTGQQAKARHVFIGRRSNAATAREMAAFIVNAVNKEAQRYQRATGGRYPEYRSFAQGAAYRIRERCQEIMLGAKGQTLLATEVKVPGTALVLADVYEREQKANDDFLLHLGVKLSQGRSVKPTRSATAHAAGRTYGSSVALQRSLK